MLLSRFSLRAFILGVSYVSSRVRVMHADAGWLYAVRRPYMSHWPVFAQHMDIPTRKQSRARLATRGEIPIQCFSKLVHCSLKCCTE